jgi:hypothetical protein
MLDSASEIVKNLSLIKLVLTPVTRATPVTVANDMVKLYIKVLEGKSNENYIIVWLSK